MNFVYLFPMYKNLCLTTIVALYTSKDLGGKLIKKVYITVISIPNCYFQNVLHVRDKERY